MKSGLSAPIRKYGDVYSEIKAFEPPVRCRSLRSSLSELPPSLGELWRDKSPRQARTPSAQRLKGFKEDHLSRRDAGSKPASASRNAAWPWSWNHLDDRGSFSRCPEGMSVFTVWLPQTVKEPNRLSSRASRSLRSKTDDRIRYRIYSSGMCLIFRGLFFEHNADIGQKDHLWTGTNSTLSH